MKNKNLNLHFVHKFVIIDHINRTRPMMECPIQRYIATNPIELSRVMCYNNKILIFIPIFDKLSVEMWIMSIGFGAKC